MSWLDPIPADIGKEAASYRTDHMEKNIQTHIHPAGETRVTWRKTFTLIFTPLVKLESPKMHIFVLWEEARVPSGEPMKASTPHGTQTAPAERHQY